jgi:aldehyde:ferredoxin oxidoreductase
MGPDDLPAQAVRILMTELEFNRKAGLTREDDRLPKMFYEEPLPPHNKVFLFSGEELDQTLSF